MPSFSGVRYRLRILLAALLEPSARLPIPIEDSTFHDAMRVQKGGATMPVANADVLGFFKSFLPPGSLEESANLIRLEALCRSASANKDSCESDVAHLLYHLV